MVLQEWLDGYLDALSQDAKRTHTRLYRHTARTLTFFDFSQKVLYSSAVLTCAGFGYGMPRF